MDGQDWTPVIVRSTVKKPSGGSSGGRGGHAATTESIRLRRLEEEDIPKPTKRLSPESRTEMIRARTAKGMSQDQLNTACSFPHGTINKIENSKYCPTPAQMNDIKRILGIIMKYA
jgi:ribosome-binding protein aMBF1 (putative translation factor)